MTRQDFADRLIEKTVHEFFCTFTQETYTGLKTIGEVLRIASRTLEDFGFSVRAREVGEILDQIRLQGPIGEDDTKWWNIWCGDPLPVSPIANGIH